jgi:hypothetical protein
MMKHNKWFIASMNIIAGVLLFALAWSIKVNSDYRYVPVNVSASQCDVACTLAKNDLKAQWKAADSVAIGNLIQLGGALLTIVSLAVAYMLYRQGARNLDLARAIHEDGKRETRIRDRPWLSVINIRWRDESHSIQLAVDVENNGNSLASGIVRHTIMERDQYDKSCIFLQDDDGISKGSFAFVKIPPKTVYQTDFVEVATIKNMFSILGGGRKTHYNLNKRLNETHMFVVANISYSSNIFIEKVSDREPPRGGKTLVINRNNEVETTICFQIKKFNEDGSVEYFRAGDGLRFSGVNKIT